MSTWGHLLSFSLPGGGGGTEKIAGLWFAARGGQYSG